MSVERTDGSRGRATFWQALLLLSVTLRLVLAPAELASQETQVSENLPLQYAQVSFPDSTRTLIQAMKQNRRGAFLRLRWFCEDGSVHPPQPYPCADRGGGHQHGELSQQARRLEGMGFHVGQLLVDLSYPDFLDEDRGHYRLREIVLQAYLQRVDDGWVNRTARFYRGSRQVEDEEAAGRRLLVRLLSDTTWVRRHFLLAMELARVVPTGQAETELQRIRTLATLVADSDPAFERVRTKIHTQPDASDVQLVELFLATREASDRGGKPAATGAKPAATGAKRTARELLSALQVYYSADLAARLEGFLETEIFQSAPWQSRFDALRKVLAAVEAGQPVHGEAVRRLAEASSVVRREAQRSPDGSRNLRRLELNLVLQQAIFREATRAGAGTTGTDASETDTVRSRLERVGSLLVAAYGRGLFSARMLEAQTESLDALLATESLTAMQYHEAVSYLERASSWAQGSVDRVFAPIVRRYEVVEPLASGFVADLLRSSVALPLGRHLDLLVVDARQQAGLSNRIATQQGFLGVRGIHPGAAVGVFRIVEDLSNLDSLRLRADEIYVLPGNARELPPVAGLLTLSQGNSLSHVQILARSLGIPSASVRPEALAALRELEGDSVLYAVSPMGRVVLERVNALGPDDEDLVREAARTRDKRLRISTEKLDVSERRVLSFADISSSAAGRTVGAKAAGLARLHRSFPDNVSPAIVLPFGLFREHLDRVEEDSLHAPDRSDTLDTPDVPDTLDLPVAPTLYERVVALGDSVDIAARSDRPLSEVTVRERLTQIREKILRRELDPELRETLRMKLEEWAEDGPLSVFVRSDTNVEDLPEFSGAGLNLTIPNLTRVEDILRAVKEVWASPFTWRAWSWRRAALENDSPAHVSVVIQRSVPVEKSGVLVTTTFFGGSPGSITVATGEGFGGAVEGEAAEMLVVSRNGRSRLLTPYAAPFRKEMSGDGVLWKPTSGSDRVLTEDEIRQLAHLAGTLSDKFAPVRDSQGRKLPWDVEFGFREGKLWLFQLRPLAAGTPLGQMKRLARLDVEEGLRTRARRSVDLDRPPESR